MSPGTEVTRPWLRRLPAAVIDASAIGLVFVAFGVVTVELAKLEDTGLVEHGFWALAGKRIAGAYWPELLERLSIAFRAAVLLTPVFFAWGWIASAWRRVRLAVSLALRGSAVLALLAPVLIATTISFRHLQLRGTGRNVVVVVMDTLRADHLGLYGYDRGTSPRLDALASEAVVFDRARSTASWTRPAIASLLSSQYPFQHGIHSERGQDRLSRTTPTLQRMLRNRGYRAEAIVTQPHYKAGMDRDFDAFYIGGNERAAKIYDRVVEFIEGQGGQPFFLLVHNLDPHDRYQFRRGFSERPKRSKLRSTDHLLPAQVGGNGIGFDSPDNHVVRLDPARLAELEDNYDGEIRYLDHHFGRLLDALEARGILDETLLIVTSDHGEEFLDHGSYWHGGTLYDELLRVPLIVRTPGMAGRRVAEPVSLIDVVPTVAEWSGAATPASAMGRSLFPLMRGEVGEARPIFSSTGFRRKRIQQSVVFDRKKLIRFEDGEFVGLFDLASDPLERHDLGPGHPSREALEALLPAPRAPAERRPAEAFELDAPLQEALEALGYTTGQDD